MDRRTKKRITMHQTLHPWDDVGRLYVPRTGGRRRLVSIEESTDASIQRQEVYIEKHKGGLITAIRKSQQNSKCSLCGGRDKNHQSHNKRMQKISTEEV